MARKTKQITIQNEGRDKGKHFLITEMSAALGADWVLKIFSILGPTLAEQDQDILKQGMAGLARIGLKSILRIPQERSKPLLDELLGCIQRIEDVRHPFPRLIVIDPLNPDGDDIEEISTFYFLYGEVFELMTGFSLAAWIVESQAAALADQE